MVLRNRLGALSADSHTMSLPYTLARETGDFYFLLTSDIYFPSGPRSPLMTRVNRRGVDQAVGSCLGSRPHLGDMDYIQLATDAGSTIEDSLIPKDTPSLPTLGAQR